MKRQYKFTALSAVLFCLIGLLYGCTRDNEIIIPETSVKSHFRDQMHILPGKGNLVTDCYGFYYGSA